MSNIKRAWETVVLKAHGYTPTWHRGSLTPESRANLKAADLHFHDLRHEGASRWVEAGVPLHHVQYLLGHASLEQTSTYLNITAKGLKESMRKIDEARALCNNFATEAEKRDSGHPTHGNGGEPEQKQVTVN